MLRFGEKRPKIGWLSFARVLDSIPDGEDCRHEGLENQPQREGSACPADNVLEYAGEQVVHSPSLLPLVLMVIGWAEMQNIGTDAAEQNNKAVKRRMSQSF